MQLQHPVSAAERQHVMECFSRQLLIAIPRFPKCVDTRFSFGSNLRVNSDFVSWWFSARMFSFFSFFERQKGAILEFFYAKRGGCTHGIRTQFWSFLVESRDAGCGRLTLSTIKMSPIFEIPRSLFCYLSIESSILYPCTVYISVQFPVHRLPCQRRKLRLAA